jgi:hypothetical protein
MTAARRRKAALAESRQLPQVRPEVLLEFVRALVRNTCGGDIIALSLMQVKSRVDATDEEMATLVAAIKQTRGRGPWPPGFMPEDEF